MNAADATAAAAAAAAAAPAAGQPQDEGDDKLVAAKQERASKQLRIDQLQVNSEIYECMGVLIHSCVHNEMSKSKWKATDIKLH